MGTPKARKEAIYEILAERLSTRIEDGEDYETDFARGNRLEPEAIALFEFNTGLKVTKAGFCESDNNPRICQSPDGLIGETMAIEVKCPREKNYIKTVIENEIPQESSSYNYYWQCIQYFVVNEKLEKLYFVTYNPDIPVYPMHIIEMNRMDIQEDITMAYLKQEEVLKEIDTLLPLFIKEL